MLVRSPTATTLALQYYFKSDFYPLDQQHTASCICFEGPYVCRGVCISHGAGERQRQEEAREYCRSCTRGPPVLAPHGVLGGNYGLCASTSLFSALMSLQRRSGKAAQAKPAYAAMAKRSSPSARPCRHFVTKTRPLLSRCAPELRCVSRSGFLNAKCTAGIV